MRKEIDGHDTDFKEMASPPSVLDVAALLKQFLRELPLPIVPRIYHLMLASAFASQARAENLLLCLLLLPSEPGEQQVSSFSRGCKEYSIYIYI